MTIAEDHERDSGETITFILDSGASGHMVNDPNVFRTWNPYDRPSWVTTSTGEKLCAMGKGDICIYPLDGCSPEGLIVKNALYVPSLEHSLVSISAMESRGLTILIDKGRVHISDHEEILAYGERRHGHYCLRASLDPLARKHLAHMTQAAETSDLKSLDREPQDWEDVRGLPQEQMDLWMGAMKTELNTFEQHGVWTPAILPPEVEPITTKWTFKIKRDEQGSPVKIRARLVARGFQQRYGQDFDEVYAPVAKDVTLRALLTLAGSKQLIVRHVDVDSAFLYGPLKEDLYVLPPKGPTCLFAGVQSYHLKAAIYGLRQAAFSWYNRIKTSLRLIEFSPTSADPCLFVKTKENKHLYILIHVDDFLIIGERESDIDKVIASLTEEYKLKNLGSVTCYLGLHVSRALNKGIFTIHQRDKIEALISRMDLQQVLPERTPMLRDYLTEKLTDTSSKMKDCRPYQQALGSVLYLANTSRPDIALAANVLGRSAHAPSQVDWKAMIRVIGYLKGTMSHRLTLGGGEHSELISYSDADYGGDPHTRRSTSGGCHFWKGGLISWMVNRQKCVSLSTSESEYVAAVESSRQTMWISSLLSELHESISIPVILLCDNQSTIALLSSLKLGQRSKHMDVKLSFLKEKIDEGIITLKHCATSNMVADIFTKPLHAPRFNQLTCRLGIQASDS